MQWLKAALVTIGSTVTGFLPSVTGIQGVALAAALAGATGGWIGYKVGVSQCQSDKIDALERAIEQSQAIAKQDAEVLSTTIKETQTIIKYREAAHAQLAATPITDCRLTPDGLRAVQQIYQADSSRAGATVDLVRATESAQGWQPDYDLTRTDRGSSSLSDYLYP